MFLLRILSKELSDNGPTPPLRDPTHLFRNIVALGKVVGKSDEAS